MRERLRVHQNLRIESVHRRGSGLVVNVGDQRGRRHWISFDFPSFDSSAVHAATMERWRQDARSLTYVTGTSHGVLIDDEELFRSALDGVDEH